MGLAVSGERIFVTEKNQVTELIDRDGDTRFETYRCVSQDWPCTMDYHEYLFGAVVHDGHLSFCNSVGMARRGKDNYQAPLRGSLIRVEPLFSRPFPPELEAVNFNELAEQWDAEETLHEISSSMRPKSS